MFPTGSNKSAAERRALASGRAVATVSALALIPGAFIATQAYAQTPSGTPAAAADAASSPETGPSDIEQVVVTGTRIVRDGYQAPTPLTVVSAQALSQASATSNVADTLNTLPVFANSQTPEASVSGISAATQGLNVLNLRGLGGNRTLTLFDGQRSVPSLFSGEVDVNNFPEQLIQRVETVTGGGSAVYGSDAIAGVVNFILDKKFTGTKVEVSGGQTTYGDDKSYKVAISEGFGFADNRGHVLLSGEIADRDGVTPGDGGRSWNNAGWGVVQNPLYGTGTTSANQRPSGVAQSTSVPQYLVRTQVALSNATHGGIIISGPLRGTYFGQGGIPYQFNYGSITNDPWTIGGDWQSAEIRHDRSGTLEPENRRRNLFARISYDLTDNINVYTQLAWGDNSTYTATWPPFQAGSGPTILSGNPFIPASVQAQMTALGLPSFTIGSMNYDFPTVGNLVNRTTDRAVVGAGGKFGLFNDTQWTWNAYYQYGRTQSETDVLNVIQTARYALAVDAVRGPNGSIVCRSTLTNPTNGCVPWNPLGTGVNTQAGLDYSTGTSSVDQSINENIFAASITGAPFNIWAGPVSFALSAEHRNDKAGGTPSGGGPWFAGNFSRFSASNKVTEGSLETIVPLAKELPGAQSLDLNAAIRITDYEFSGTVETWKVGLVWAPIDSLKFRATYSKDIRAPNFNELFAVGNSGQRSAFDPFTNTIPQYFGATTGNPNLKPEEGKTGEFGIVFQPSFIQGFSASVDYWNIKLTGAIASPNDNQTLQFCFQGQTDFCNNIVRDANGVVTKVTLTPFNLASQKRSGIDFELSQIKPLQDVVSSWDGTLSARVLGTYYLTSKQDDGLGLGEYSTLEDEGQLIVGPPKWRLTSNLGYSVGGFTGALIARLQSAGKIDARYIECSTGCPVSNSATNAITIEDNHIAGAFYLDSSLAYDFSLGEKATLEAFFNVRNILNRAPAYVPLGPTDFTYVSPLSKGSSGFDLLGREFLVGVRLKL